MDDITSKSWTCSDCQSETDQSQICSITGSYLCGLCCFRVQVGLPMESVTKALTDSLVLGKQREKAIVDLCLNCGRLVFLSQLDCYTYSSILSLDVPFLTYNPQRVFEDDLYVNYPSLNVPGGYKCDEEITYCIVAENWEIAERKFEVLKNEFNILDYQYYAELGYKSKNIKHLMTAYNIKKTQYIIDRIAEVHYHNNGFEYAIKWYQDLPENPETKKKIAACYRWLADSYNDENDAIQNLEEAIKLYGSPNEPDQYEFLAAMYYKIAEMKNSKPHYKKAAKYYEKYFESLEFRVSWFGDNISQEHTNLALVNCYRKSEQYQLALNSAKGLIDNCPYKTTEQLFNEMENWHHYNDEKGIVSVGNHDQKVIKYIYDGSSNEILKLVDSAYKTIAKLISELHLNIATCYHKFPLLGFELIKYHLEQAKHFNVPVKDQRINDDIREIESSYAKSQEREAEENHYKNTNNLLEKSEQTSAEIKGLHDRTDEIKMHGIELDEKIETYTQIIVQGQEEIKHGVNEVNYSVLVQDQKIDNLQHGLKDGVDQIREDIQVDGKQTRKVVKDEAEKTREILNALVQLRNEVSNELKKHQTNIEEQEKIYHDFSEALINKVIETMDARSDIKYGDVEKDLIGIFGDSWEKLSTDSKDYLITSRIVYNNTHTYQIDFSPVCIPLTKALERELYNYFFDKFKQYCATNEVKEHMFPSGIKRTFTLGSIPYIFGSKTAEGSSPYNRVFVRYCSVLFKSTIFKSEFELVNYLRKFEIDISRITNDYRNQAAHKDKIGKIQAEKCYNYLISVEKVLVNFMTKLA